jgi:hypothetical protein
MGRWTRFRRGATSGGCLAARPVGVVHILATGVGRLDLWRSPLSGSVWTIVRSGGVVSAEGRG